MYGKGSRQYLKRGHKKSPQTCEHYTMHIDNQSGLYCLALQIWGFIFRMQKEKLFLWKKKVIMKFITQYFKKRYERKLRERCVKYATEAYRGTGYSPHEEAEFIYRFILEGSPRRGILKAT